MNTAFQSIRVALFFIFGVALIWVVYETLNRSTFYQEKGYKVLAYFTDIKQLKEGDDVRLSGVRIGSVNETTLQGDFAVVVLNIEKDYKIPSDSVAMISTAGLLGANYIAITAGKSQKEVAPEGILPTKTSADISTVINQFGDIGKNVQELLGTAKQSLASEEGKGMGDFFRKLNDLIDNNHDAIQSIIKNTNKITGDISEGKGTLAMLIKDEKMAQNVRETIEQVRSFSEKLNNDKSTLGRLITTDGLYKKAEDTLTRVDATLDSFEDNGPLTAVGVAASALF